MSLLEKLELPEKHIPNGYYCYENNRNTPCPFWDSKPGEYPHHEDGYCHYLQKSDWDLNEESDGGKIIYVGDNVDSSIISKTMDELIDDEIDEVSGKKIHFTTSLIWDQVKECNINMTEHDDTEIVVTDNETHITTYTTVGEIKNKGKK